MSRAKGDDPILFLTLAAAQLSYLPTVYPKPHLNRSAKSTRDFSPVLSHECSNPSVPLSCSQISTPSFPAAPAASLANLPVLKFSHICHTGPPCLSTRPKSFSPLRNLLKQKIARGKVQDLSKLDSVVTSRSAQWLVPTPSSIISERAALPRFAAAPTLPSPRQSRLESL